MAGQGWVWSALVVGVVAVGAACGPSEELARASNSLDDSGARGRFCGGIGNLPCPTGSVCQDDPSDDCDPQNGGADCGGICVAEETEQLRTCGGEPGYHYVLTDPVACQGVRFKCAEGFTAFFNDCGCGCKPLP